MKFKKFILIFNIVLLFIFTGCLYTNADSKAYNSDIVIKGLSLKVSLIQTAYEMYNINIGNPSYFNEDLYKKTSKEAYKHYKWLKKTYSGMDDEMKIRLKNIFSSKDDWDYINATINLNDDASADDIINTLIADESLGLSNYLKKDVDKFFTYFYDDYFKYYFKKNKNKYDKKAIDLNQKLSNNNVNVANFIETSSGIHLKNDYKSIMYCNLDPIESQSFEYDTTMISTINLNTTAIDAISIPFYKYSRVLFNTFTDSNEFLNTCNSLKSDKKLLSMYNDFYDDTYTFNDWCAENLISGFSNYLNYKYYGCTYERASYVYDLDFYNYLKDIGFNPNKMSLKDVSINFYKDVINQ